MRSILKCCSNFSSFFGKIVLLRIRMESNRPQGFFYACVEFLSLSFCNAVIAFNFLPLQHLIEFLCSFAIYKSLCMIFFLVNYGDRYEIRKDSRMSTFLEKHVPKSNGSLDSQTSEFDLSWLPQIVKDLFLPTGYPGIINLVPFRAFIQLPCLENIRNYMPLQLKRIILIYACNDVSRFSFDL